MDQTSKTLAALFLAFFVYILAKGELPAYLALVLKSNTKAVGAGADPTGISGASNTGAQGASIGGAGGLGGSPTLPSIWAGG